MGGLCSKVSTVSKSPSDTTLGRNQVVDHEPGTPEGEKPPVSGEAAEAKRLEEQQQQQSFSFLESVVPGLAFHGGANAGDAVSRTSPQLARSLSQKAGLGKAKAGGAKVSEVGSILGRASTVGLEKAVEVLDTLGSSMTSLNASSAFVSSAAAKGNKVSMLAFEVANTIVRGSNLMRSLSKPSMKHLKEVFHSEGVQLLISKDMDELLKIAAADKREELEVFSKEVVRFGNHCKNPQWHNLDRFFEKLASERTPQHRLKEDAESVMQKLIPYVQYTAELYHELHALDRFQHDYDLKLKEQDGLSSRGDGLHILKQEMKDQTKHVKNLKKRSLWSKNLEEVMENLVDIVHFLHLEIYNAFDCADSGETQEPAKHHNRLGQAGLALHYANIINQIDALVSRSSAIPPNMRDTLYHNLPLTIKSALHSRLKSFEPKEELTVSQIKAEMKKTLRWLVPTANNTTKAHHGFGWVGEWANTGSEFNYKLSGQMDMSRIETLYHAEKEKTEAVIFELVVWLHLLISKSRKYNGGIRSPIKSPVSSPTQKGIAITLLLGKTNNSSPVLTQEDQDMLRDVKYRKFSPGISKSQEFDTKSRHNSQSRLSKSNSHSPASGNRKDLLAVRRSSMLPVIDFEIDRTKALDLIDRLDDLRIH